MPTKAITKTPARRSTRKPQPLTDRQRFDAVFAGLAAAGVAYWFDLRGATGVREDRYNDYVNAAERCGTDRWVGEHVGNVDTGGAHWSADGVLMAGRGDKAVPMETLWWSWNHEHPEVGVLLVQLFTEQGFDAYCSDPELGDPVVVNLKTPRAA